MGLNELVHKSLHVPRENRASAPLEVDNLVELTSQRGADVLLGAPVHESGPFGERLSRNVLENFGSAGRGEGELSLERLATVDELNEVVSGGEGGEAEADVEVHYDDEVQPN